MKLALSRSNVIPLFFSLILLIQAQAFAVSPTILVVDSSFAPLSVDDLHFSSADQCDLMDEKNSLVTQKGPCFDDALWKKLGSFETRIFEGIMDSLANKNSASREGLADFNQKNPSVLGQLKKSYILATHGTRSAYVAYIASDKKSKILRLRNVSTQGGATEKQDSSRLKQKNPQASEIYSNGCKLRNWSSPTVDTFKKGKIQDYQQRIAVALERDPNVRVINLSLGYKQSWIAEDSRDCDPQQVAKEYEVLSTTWRNLLTRFKDRLFVVAAGNENEDFDQPSVRSNDLWASLSDLPNLLLVGSLTQDKQRLKTSNYGKNVQCWALGEEISVLSPLPGKNLSYSTTLRGTSFSAPIVAGNAALILSKAPNLGIQDLTQRLKVHFKKTF